MKFKGQPNLFVRISNKYVQRVTGKKGFQFDNNGEYETDNDILIKLLSQHFEVVEEHQYKCKKCGFTCDNKCELLAHYKTHKEE